MSEYYQHIQMVQTLSFTIENKIKKNKKQKQLLQLLIIETLKKIVNHKQCKFLKLKDEVKVYLKKPKSTLIPCN